MRDKDHELSGLVTMFQSQKSGPDNSPIWDKPLARIKVKNLPKFKRFDIVDVQSGFKAAETIPNY